MYNTDHHLTLHNFCVAIGHTKCMSANLYKLLHGFSHIMQTFKSRFESSFVGDVDSFLCLLVRNMMCPSSSPRRRPKQQTRRGWLMWHLRWHKNSHANQTRRTKPPPKVGGSLQSGRQIDSEKRLLSVEIRVEEESEKIQTTQTLHFASSRICWGNAHICACLMFQGKGEAALWLLTDNPRGSFFLCWHLLVTLPSYC